MVEHSRTVLRMICGIILRKFSNLYLQKIACAKRFQNVLEYFSRIFQACSQHIPSKIFPNKIVSNVSRSRLRPYETFLERSENSVPEVFQNVLRANCRIQSDSSAQKADNLRVVSAFERSRHVPELFQARSENGSSRL